MEQSKCCWFCIGILFLHLTISLQFSLLDFLLVRLFENTVWEDNDGESGEVEFGRNLEKCFEFIMWRLSSASVLNEAEHSRHLSICDIKLLLFVLLTHSSWPRTILFIWFEQLSTWITWLSWSFVHFDPLADSGFEWAESKLFPLHESTLWLVCLKCKVSCSSDSKLLPHEQNKSCNGLFRWNCFFCSTLVCKSAFFDEFSRLLSFVCGGKKDASAGDTIWVGFGLKRGDW